MSSATSQSLPPPDTREKILDAAEALFVELGFAATSLRAIASRARVNLAATHYHFGSKTGLLAEVFHRRVGPINELRLAELKRLRDSAEPLTARGILQAYFLPFTTGDMSPVLPALVGWIYSEPEAVSKPVFEREFAEVASTFQDALASVLPEVDRGDLRWRFHFMVGSMIHLMKINAPLCMQPSSEPLAVSIERLINFSLAGLGQQGSGTSHD